jgi:hypothetical protein
MLLELDTAAHARLWEDRRREVVDPRRAAELIERLRRPRRSDERPYGGTAGGGRAGPADGPGTVPRPDGRPRADGPR